MLEFLSKYQCGFRKCYNKQHCLLAMLGKWKSAVDKGKSFGALLTDLSKAFDCLSYELLLAKLHAFGFSIATLKLIHSYLTNRAENKSKLLQVLGGNIVCCTTWIHSRTFIVQDLPVLPIFHNERNWLRKLCRW